MDEQVPCFRCGKHPVVDHVTCCDECGRDAVRCWLNAVRRDRPDFQAPEWALRALGELPPEKRYRKGDIPERRRWEIFERDDFRCRQCGSRKTLRVDHIIPEAKGGTLDPSNLQTLCETCNCRKGRHMAKAA